MKRFLILGLLLSTAQFSADARLRHVIYDDGMEDFFGSDYFDDMRNFFPHYTVKESEERIQRRNEIENAHQKLNDVKPTLNQTDNSVSISFPIKDIDKNNINISVHDNTVKGSIPSKYGVINFIVHPNYFEIVKNIEIKYNSEKEENKDKQNLDYSSSSSYMLSLPAPVVVSSVQASTKDDVLTIELAKKKEKKINIKHTNSSIGSTVDMASMANIDVESK